MSNCDFKVSGDDLLKKIKAIINEGNARRIIIKNEKGKEYMEIPVNIGVLGLFFAPVLVAVGAIAAMASCFTIEVVRKETAEKPKTVRKNK
jgi:hypothetical protein